MIAFLIPKFCSLHLDLQKLTKKRKSIAFDFFVIPNIWRTTYKNSIQFKQSI